MTRILVGEWKTEFHFIIPAYFKAKPTDLTDKLSRNGFKFSMHRDKEFEAEYIYITDRESSQKITIAIIYNNKFRYYIGPNAVELTVRGPTSLKRVANKVLEEIMSALSFEEVGFIDREHDFVVPEVSFPNMHQVKQFYEKRKTERGAFAREWKALYNASSYTKRLNYEPKDQDKK